MEKTAQAAAELVKKPYSTPKLMIYGNLASMTAGVNGTKADPGHSSPTRKG
jgi:hypothetical protein